MGNEILYICKFNSGQAFCMKDRINLKYKRYGDTIIGTDGPFFDCYYYQEGYGKAFAGREFTLVMEDGEVVKCDGNWWDGKTSKVTEILGETVHVTAKYIKGLQHCYVYYGYECIKNEMEKLINAYDGPIYNYYDVEKLINYDDLRKKLYKQQDYYKKSKRHILNNLLKK